MQRQLSWLTTSYKTPRPRLETNTMDSSTSSVLSFSSSNRMHIKHANNNARDPHLSAYNRRLPPIIASLAATPSALPRHRQRHQMTLANLPIASSRGTMWWRPSQTCSQCTRTRWPYPSSSTIERLSASKKRQNCGSRSDYWPIKWRLSSRSSKSWRKKLREAALKTTTSAVLTSRKVRTTGRVDWLRGGARKCLMVCWQINATSS